jgi:hypothetical protein
VCEQSELFARVISCKFDSDLIFRTGNDNGLRSTKKFLATVFSHHILLFGAATHFVGFYFFIFLSSYIKSILKKGIAQFFIRIPCREKKPTRKSISWDPELLMMRVADICTVNIAKDFVVRVGTAWGYCVTELSLISSFSRAFLSPFFVGLLS